MIIEEQHDSEVDVATDYLREQLRQCSAAFDRQQQQLDRNAEQNAAQLAELHRISEALGTNEGHSSVTHIEILKEENAALREQLKQVEAGYATRNDEVTGLLGMHAELREQLAAAIDAAKGEGK